MAGTALAGLALAAPVVLAADQSVSITPSPGFSPNNINVNPGDTVTWTNNDPNVHHNAFCGQACPDQFGGALLAYGKSENFTFKYSGTYNYFCSAHPNMHGVVNVSGNVQPPASGGSGSTPSTPGAAAAGGGSTTAGNTTGSRYGNGGTAAAPAPSSTGVAQGSPAPSSEQIVRDYLARAKIPAPHVTLLAHTTPDWVVAAAAAGLFVAAILFGLSWFGVPRLRLPRSKS